MPLLDLAVGRLRLVVTDRGPAAGDRFGDANLSLSVGDEPDRVRRNRDSLADLVGVARDRLLFLHQVHGDHVLDDAQVTAAVSAAAENAPTADGAVVSTPGTAVAVTAADCLPLLLADPVGGVGGAAHVGRRGLGLGIAGRCLDRLRAAGAGNAIAVLGPAIGPCCYEVSADLRDQIDALVPGTAARTRWGTPSIDIRAGVRSQLLAAGMAKADLRDVDVCTHEAPTLFSYRREGLTGRFAGVVAVGA